MIGWIDVGNSWNMAWNVIQTQNTNDKGAIVTVHNTNIFFNSDIFFSVKHISSIINNVSYAIYKFMNKLDKATLCQSNVTSIL